MIMNKLSNQKVPTMEIKFYGRMLNLLNGCCIYAIFIMNSLLYIIKSTKNNNDEAIA